MNNLPVKVKIPLKILKDKQYDSVADYLSDNFGFCVNSFRIKNGYATEIDWDIED